jgi:hypothetical protein
VTARVEMHARRHALGLRGLVGNAAVASSGSAGYVERMGRVAKKKAVRDAVLAAVEAAPVIEPDPEERAAFDAGLADIKPGAS